MSYQRVLITRHGGSEVLQLVEDELPEPLPGEVRVRVLATGVAFTDILIREGLYPGVPKVPFSPGYEIIGIVDKLGADVFCIKPGERVVALTITGGYSEFLCLPATELVKVPEGVDSAEAVCLVLQYVTAYQLLHRVAQVHSNQKVLIHGAGGGVGTALLELGQLANLKMYGTASGNKRELVESLGGIPIDYQHTDFRQQIRNMTTSGVDVVFDAIGGNHLLSSYQTLTAKGKLISYGFSSALRGPRGRFLRVGVSLAILSCLQLLPDNRQAVFYSIAGLKRKYPEWFRDDLTTLLNLLLHQQIKPIIADRLPLKAAAYAHELLEKSSVRGQLVLLCSNQS